MRDLTPAALPILAVVCLAVGCAHTARPGDMAQFAPTDADEIAALTARYVGLGLVPVEAQGIGYAYRDAPELIYPHIRRFLDDVNEREARDAGWPADAVFASGGRGGGVLHVALPTGRRDADRASILAAVEQARPGDTIQFAPGRYSVGDLVPVTTTRITLLGHADGTVLRGCDPDAFAAMERDAVQALQSPDPQQPGAAWAVLSRCGMFELSGGHVTVRNLTFEYSRLGLVLGCCGPGQAFRPTDGGYLIDGNTFRNSGNSIRASLSSPEPTLIRDNRFINTFHALSARGSNLRFLDNHVSVPEPGAVPGGHPGFALSIGSILPGMAPDLPAGACVGNIIAGNQIDGHPNGIFIVAEPGTACTGAVVRDNTIVVRRARFSADWPYAVFMPLTHGSDSTFVGVPLTLWGIPDDDEPGGVITDAVVEGNRILGAEGIGLELVSASRNRVVNNTITGVVRREPYSGNLDGPPPQWGEEHNGSGIWVSAGSNENEITGNTFDDIASAAIVVRGDRNRVAVRSAADSVRDEGVGNSVAQADEAVSAAQHGTRAVASDLRGIRAITDVDIVDVERGLVIPRQTVLITGNRISAVGPATDTRIPAGAEVIEARGTYLIPGLWDMHVHSSSDRITRATMLPMYVANGITGVRDMHADCFEPCDADRSTILQVNGWRRDIAAGRLVGPRIVAASQELNGPPPGEPSSVHSPATAEEGRAVVRLLQQRGVDFIKTYDMLPREAYFGLADEARSRSIQFAGHVPVEVRASEASDAGQRSMEHLTGILDACSEREDELRPRVVAQLKSDTPRVLSTALLMADSFSEARCAALFATFVANGTWQVPTLLVHDKAARMEWRDDPRLRYVPPEEHAVWEQIQKYEIETLWGRDPEGFARLHRVMSDIVLSMHRAGVRILAGSDAAFVGAFPGFSLHDELELLVAAGLTPTEALRAGTLGPAEYLEATDSLGAVAPGRLADLVLLEANPLDDIRNTKRMRAVFSDGRYFDRPALDRLLAGIEAAAAGDEVVHVAPPTGERDADRTSILAALAQVPPGGTVQFAPGMYVAGGMNLDVNVPGIRLLGHADGTVIRGCEPDVFEDFQVAMNACNALGLSGPNQTVRGLVFEYAWHGIVIGCCLPGSVEDYAAWEGPEHVHAGGHVIEGNTFRYTPNGMRVLGRSEEPTVIRDNRFIDVYHAIGINGGGVHFLDNDISVHEPHRVPTSTHPGDPINISPTGDAGDHTTCTDNVIAGNRIDGHTHGVRISVFRPNTSCRRNVIRDNTINVRRVPFAAPWVGIRLSDEADSTVVGVPLQLVDFTKAEPERYGDPDADAPALIEDNVIERNRINGAEGIAIEVLHASRNRIANNVISGIRPRAPFPGNVLSEPVPWREANGSGIWISPGSDDNEIIGNTFTDVAAAAIVVQGDHNRVLLRSEADSVLDTGSGNTVTHEVQAHMKRFIRALKDESTGFLMPFFAEDATLTLADGQVLRGREAIMRDYFRGNIARIRGLVPTSSTLSEDERGTSVVIGYTARIAPAASATRGSFSTTWARQPDGGWLIVDGTFAVPQYTGYAAVGPIRSGMFDSSGVQLHYVDFGGEGVPILFVHSGDRTGYTFMEFAPRFTDRHRVLAISQRGAGLSGGDPAPGVAALILAGDVVALLDALQIDSAVIAGQWANLLIRLAEEYPHRVAGLVFLESHAIGEPDDDVAVQDPIGVLRMLRLNRAALWDADPNEADAGRLDVSRYRHPGARLDVPALSFVAETPSAGDDWEQILRLARLAETSTTLFRDAGVRAYFQRLAVDIDMQNRGRTFWSDVVAPAQQARERALERAFGDRLRIVHVEPRAVGYGYRDAPDAIYPHIRRWLDEIGHAGS